MEGVADPPPTQHYILKFAIKAQGKYYIQDERPNWRYLPVEPSTAKRMECKQPSKVLLFGMKTFALALPTSIMLHVLVTQPALSTGATIAFK